MGSLAAPKNKPGTRAGPPKVAGKPKNHRQKSPGNRLQTTGLGPLQAKLEINDPNDQYEREADRVADRVMATSDSEARTRRISRVAAPEGSRPSVQRDEEEEAETAQTMALQRAEEEEAETAQTMALQRAEEEEAETAQTMALQRAEEEEAETAQTMALQRAEEEEAETAQTMALQRAEEEEAETAQTMALQRAEEEEAETAQTMALQRAEEEEAETAQTMALQRAEEEEAETAQTMALQRAEEEEAETAHTMALQRAEEEEAETAQTMALQRAEEEEDHQVGGCKTCPPPVGREFESSVAAMRRHRGQPLPDTLRSFLEPRFGRSFDEIRVHTGPDAAKLAKQARAKAFTVGKSIFFGSGHYQPAADQGRRLIAHELTHVLQQNSGLHSVQRDLEADAEPVQKSHRTADVALEELRELMQLRRSVVSPAILKIVEEQLRSTLHSDSAVQLTALLDPGQEATRVSRIIESGGYRLQIDLNTRGGAGGVRWSLTRLDDESQLFSHQRELAVREDGGGVEADEARITLPTPLPPRGVEPPRPSPPSEPEEVSGQPEPAAFMPEPIKSEALEKADAPAPVKIRPKDAHTGESAGKDAPSQLRKPVDEDPEAEDVPEEPAASDREQVRRKTGTGRVHQVSLQEFREVTESEGKSPPPAVREFLQPRMDADLDQLRIHDDSGAGNLVTRLGAEAFAYGEHIAFAPGRFQPETPSGRRLIAHEVAHVLQQREGAPDLVRRQGDDCPPVEPVPEIEVVHSPQTPSEDPAFNAAANRADNRADDQREHGPGEEKSESANSAAEVKEGEKKGHAQAGQVETMEAEAGKVPGFDKQGFVDKVLAEVEKIAPGTLDDVLKFDGRSKAGEVKQAVGGQLKSSQEADQSGLKSAASEDPAPGEVPRTPGELGVEGAGPAPASVRADKAMPPPKTDSEIDMSAETASTENILKEACVTSEFMEKHDDPELKAGIAAQNEVAASAESSPAKFREQEAAALEEAQGGASGAGAQGLAQMLGARSGSFDSVGQGQQGAKSGNEAKREAAAREIDGIFTTTQTNVENRLNKLDTDVMTNFDTEAAAATDRFQSFIRHNAEKYQKSWFDTATEWLAEALFDAPPAEVWDFYKEGRATFLTEMRTVIQNIADMVGEGLADARSMVEQGKADVKAKLDSLGSDLDDFKQQVGDQMKDRFRGLETAIDDKQKEMVTGLAKRYVAAFENVKKIEAQVRDEFKNVLERAADVYNAIKDAVLGWIEKLTSVVSSAATRIIRDPGQFLSNLWAGISQGLSMFVDNIGENIKGAVVEWLTGTAGGAGIKLPETFDAKGIIGFLLDLAGLGITNIKEIARKVFGPKVVGLIEKGEAGFEKIREIFGILVAEGPAGLFRYLQAEFESMKEQVLGESGKALAEGLIIAGIKKIASLLSGLVTGGVGTVITIVLTIVDVILWFRDNAARLAELVGEIAGMAVAILEGQVAALANAVNKILKRLLPVVLSLVGALVGIGGVVGKIQKIFKAIKKPATKAITALFKKIKKSVDKLLKKLFKKGKKKKGPKPMDRAAVMKKVLTQMKKPPKAKEPAAALAEKKAQAASLVSKFGPRLTSGKLKIAILDSSVKAVEEDSAVDFDVSASPGVRGEARLAREKEDARAVRKRFKEAKSLAKFSGQNGFSLAVWGSHFSSLAASTHQGDIRFGISNGLIREKDGRYLFSSDLKDAVKRGAAEITRRGNSHGPFKGGRFGIPLIQAFLSGRTIRGVPPGTFDDAELVSRVSSAAEKQKTIEKVGKTATWTLAAVPPKRELPADWGGVSHIRPSLYEKGAGFATIADKLFDKELARKIDPNITKLIANPAAAAPWNALKTAQLATPNEKFYKTKVAHYLDRGRYDVDHVTPLAKHWSLEGGNNSPQPARTRAAQGSGGSGLKLVHRTLNRSKSSEGVNYQLWVGPAFKSDSGDNHHVVSGVPFKNF